MTRQKWIVEKASTRFLANELEELTDRGFWIYEIFPSSDGMFTIVACKSKEYKDGNED
jgi:hypothetical protein